MSSINSLFQILPPDIIFQIFARLPLKSMFLSKSVCKQWYRLISHKDFKIPHFETYSREFGLLCELRNLTKMTYPYYNVNMFSDLSLLSFDFMSFQLRVLHRCRCLLLCENLELKTFCICNPSIKNFSQTPRAININTIFL
ncbi:F-box protein [Platanthera zijinensis]|uniref:F-box protein n=1 Tax=Platanthera zijinensis TaxID=2320716 RepID=A0AAP0B5B5_9ASPA